MKIMHNNKMKSDIILTFLESGGASSTELSMIPGVTDELSKGITPFMSLLTFAGATRASFEREGEGLGEDPASM